MQKIQASAVLNILKRWVEVCSDRKKHCCCYPWWVFLWLWNRRQNSVPLSPTYFRILHLLKKIIYIYIKFELSKFRAAYLDTMWVPGGMKLLSVMIFLQTWIIRDCYDMRKFVIKITNHDNFEIILFLFHMLQEYFYFVWKP